MIKIWEKKKMLKDVDEDIFNGNFVLVIKLIYVY